MQNANLLLKLIDFILNIADSGILFAISLSTKGEKYILQRRLGQEKLVDASLSASLSTI